jgi:tight adherence protein C
MIASHAAALAGMALGATCGGCLSVAFAQARRESHRRRDARAIAVGTDDDALLITPETSGIARHVLLLMQRESRRENVRTADSTRPYTGRFLPDRTLLCHAGLEHAVTPSGIRAAQMKATLSVGGLFGLMGAVFSGELVLVGLVMGLALGFAAPSWALKREARTRGEDAERNLSEMIEVVMLGLRSGLSLERSMALYPHYFDSGLARSVSRMVGEWETGLVPREEALRRLARQYDSVLLGRVTEDAIRSLRFGSPLADALESTALEARTQHKARVEERIAKAPVKMMLPVGTLILPAMLLLVMGPVILELMTEF